MTFGRLQQTDKAQRNSSLLQSLLQHTRDWALQLRQGVVSASPGFQGCQFWVWESEFMSPGNFSTEHYAVCVAQNPDSVPLSMKPAMNRPPGIFVDGQWTEALVDGQWTEVPGTLLTSSSNIVVLSLKNIWGLFKNFYSS